MSKDNPQNRDYITDEPGSHPVGTSVGTLGGAVAGAVAGIVAGPAGVIIGAVAGGIAGGIAGHHIGEGMNPSEGVLISDEHAVGSSIGSTAGAIAGGVAGTLVAGPLGTLAGAALGASVGVYAGSEAEEAMDKNDQNLHIGHADKDELLITKIRRTFPKNPVDPDTILTSREEFIDSTPLDERDYKPTNV